MASPSGPGYSSLTKVDDPDDAMRRLRPVLGDCEIRLGQGVKSFGMEFGLAVFDIAKFLTWRFETACEVDFSFDQFLICAARKGDVVFESGQSTFIVGNSRTAILPPSRPGRFSWGPGATLLCVAIGESDFRRGSRLVAGGAPMARLSARQFDAESRHGAILSELVEFLDLDHRGGRPSPRNRSVCQMFDRMVIYSLLRMLEDDLARKAGEAAHSVVPRHVKQAEEYIKAHLAEPLDSVSLANAIDVSPRSLHRGFVDFRGVTPARYIQDLRLEAAHRQMSGGGDIGRIAAGLGFKSYAAFWRSYVRRFGVTPSKSKGHGTDR